MLSLPRACSAEARADQPLVASWATPATQKPVHKAHLRKGATAPTTSSAGFAAYLADVTR